MDPEQLKAPRKCTNCGSTKVIKIKDSSWEQDIEQRIDDNDHALWHKVSDIEYGVECLEDHVVGIESNSNELYNKVMGLEKKIESVLGLVMELLDTVNSMR